MRNLQVRLLILLLLVAGLGLMQARVSRLGLPLLPDQESDVWAVEAQVSFDGRGRAAKVDLDIPDSPRGFIVLDEYFISRDYGMTVGSVGTDRYVEWSVRRARGTQRLYYRVELLPETANGQTARAGKAPPPPQAPDYEEPLGSAIEGLLGDVRSESADIFSFTSQLLVRLNAEAPDDNAVVVRRGVSPGSQAWVERIMYVLAGARISARMVLGVVLTDEAVQYELTPWLEVHNGQHWEGFDPMSGNKGFPPRFLRWSTGGKPVLTIDGGRNPGVRFSVSRYSESLTKIARDRADAEDSPLSLLTLSRLPLGTQNLYRILLMIPVGIIVVVVLRTFVGIPTFGTFMPVLVAIAFRQTQLAWGIGLFALIVSSGLLIRFYLERLQLLLVPRLSAVLVVVVMLMLAISLFSHGMGIDQGFSIALFPIVIMAMTVEHMSVVWEESGPFTAMREALGTLVVAVLSFLLMNEPHLQHLMFMFPELLLVLLAFFLFAGRYTGYRLTELWRFRDLAVEDSHAAGKDP